MKKQTHLDDFLEWQEYQYNPAHFTGGKQIPVYKARGKRAAKWWFFEVGVGTLGYVAILYFFNRDDTVIRSGDSEMSPLLACALASIVFLPLIVFGIRMGIKCIKEAPGKAAGRSHKRKRGKPRGR